MPSDKFCDCFGCVKYAECYCDKCNYYLCSTHEFKDHNCSKYYCRQDGCREKATWTCDGCKKILCTSHSNFTNHNCSTCYYCNRKATNFCTGNKGCDKYVCSMYNCDGHVRACPYNSNNSNNSFRTTPCPRCYELRYFNGGRDPCPNCQASGFV